MRFTTGRLVGPALFLAAGLLVVGALAVGTRVAAEGAVRPTVTGHRVIEATAVNGVETAQGKPHH